jgi:hypothetical protein
MMLLRAVGAVLTLFAGQALVVAGVAALRRRGNIYVTIVGVSVVTVPLIVGLESWLFGRRLDTDGRIFFALMHLALGGFLFHFMTLPDRSVTLRILAELERAPNRTLSVAELTAKYSVREMIASRLDQLAAGHFLEIAPDGRLDLKPRGVRFGRFVAGGRRLFGISSAN